MHGKFLTFCILLFCTISYGQIGGQHVYQFLNLVTSPRQAALGGKIITIYDEDVNTAHFNPASINAAMDNRIALNYASYYGEVTYGTASYAYNFEGKYVQTMQAGVNYVNYGKFDGRDENGNETSEFTGSEIAMSVGYGYVVPNTKLHLGASAKLISSTLESYNSFGGALDIGAMYIRENETNYSLVIRNIGTQFSSYDGTKETLPLEIMVGVSQQLQNVPIRWHLTLENLQQWNVAFSNPARAQGTIDGGTEEEEVSVFNNALRHVIFGFELFPKRAFNFRVGYNFRRSEELRVLEQRHFSGLSVGFGLKLNRFKFNYSYSRYTLAANTSLFGLTINFGEN
ncbi:MAG TPA: type IX secretion system protein PorQ [Flavobacterium sp.]|jgi:hypothetical protein